MQHRRKMHLDKQEGVIIVVGVAEEAANTTEVVGVIITHNLLLVTKVVGLGINLQLME